MYFLLDIRFTTVTQTVSLGRHRPVMALTRAMASKLASQSPVVDRDVSSSPPKTSPRLWYPSSSSSSSTSSASSSSSFSSSHTPTTLVTDSPPSISSVSLFNNFVEHVSQKFHDMFQKIEHISNRMSNIEESIGDQRFIINELERELAIIADRLKKISSPKRSSVKTTVHKGTQTNDINLNLTSFPRIDPRVLLALSLFLTLHLFSTPLTFIVQLLNQFLLIIPLTPALPPTGVPHPHLALPLLVLLPLTRDPKIVSLLILPV